MLGDDDPSEAELRQLREAVDSGNRINVELADFMVRAVSLAGGKSERHPNRLAVAAVPPPWLGGRMPDRFHALYADHEAAPNGVKPDEILDHQHRLVQSAIRWVRQTRYSKDDDHRLAARLVDGIEEPDVIATFLATVRAADHTEMEQLIAVRVSAGGAVDEEDGLPLLHQQGAGNVPPDCIPRLFGSWWETAVEKAQEHARQRAERWKSSPNNCVLPSKAS